MKSARGYLLIEALVYISVFLVLTGMGGAAFYKALENSRRLQVNAEDVARVLQAGERWRRDIRSATGPIQTFDDEGRTGVEIPVRDRTIVYLFSDGAVWRRENADSLWEVAVPWVRSSAMAPGERRHVSAWTWDVELETAKNQAAPQAPLFGFVAVSGGSEE